jgi:hypothetical protein
MAEVEAWNVSCVEQFGLHDFGENAAETPCGSPETEKLIDRFLKAVALIVLVTDDPCVTITGGVSESDKLDVWVDVAAVRTISEDARSPDVVELWLESAGMAWR